jgi:hypothetical protein
MTDADKQAEATRIKARLDDLREEWDRLDAHGAQSEKQNSITGAIENLQAQLKTLTGEDY